MIELSLLKSELWVSHEGQKPLNDGIEQAENELDNFAVVVKDIKKMNGVFEEWQDERE